MKLGSLFDGSGGFPLAGAYCGIEPVWAAEIEPYPIAVTRSRFPTMMHLGSVTEVRGDVIEPVDVITFGSHLSVAGKRAGLKHESNGDEETTRSGLFMDAIRITKEMRRATNGVYPRFAIWENVPGAFSSNKGEDFRIVLEELIKIVEPTAVVPPVPKNGWPYADCYSGDGWSLAYRVLDAQFWGVPQRRRRIYLVFDFGGQCAGEVLFEREGLRGYFAESRAQREGVTSDAEGSSGADDCTGECVTYCGSFLPQKKAESMAWSTEDVSCTLHNGACPGHQNGVVLSNLILDDQGGQQIGVRTDGVSPTLRAEMHGNVPCVMESAGFKEHNSPEARSIGYDHEVSPCLSATKHDACAVYSIENHPNDSRVSIDDSGKVQTLTSRMGTGGGNVPMVMEQKAYGIGNGQANQSVMEECVGTLNCMHDQQAVVYSFDSLASNSMKSSNPYSGCRRVEVAKTLDTTDPNPSKNQGGIAIVEVAGVDCRNATEYPEKTGTLQHDCYKNLNSNGVVRTQYIVRRLTPTECARLQGFPDNWGHPDIKAEFTDEEYAFWLNVRNTYAEINGKAVKDYTRDQMVKWYNKLHTDSSEYKMWGNGIALPCALYVMQGVQEVLTR